MRLLLVEDNERLAQSVVAVLSRLAGTARHRIPRRSRARAYWVEKRPAAGAWLLVVSRPSTYLKPRKTIAGMRRPVIHVAHEFLGLPKPSSSAQPGEPIARLVWTSNPKVPVLAPDRQCTAPHELRRSWLTSRHPRVLILRQSRHSPERSYSGD
jgi:hypothetical protein